MLYPRNIANKDTTKTEDGQPYRRKMVVFKANESGLSFSKTLNSAQNTQKSGGVSVSGIIEDEEALKPVYDPTHPDANEEGYVMMPNISTVKEMIDMMSATRSYEANVTAFNAVKQMAAKALEIGR